MFIATPDTLTQREKEEFEQEKEIATLHSGHTIRLKELELDIEREKAKWSNIQKIPLTIIQLPIMTMLAIAYILSMFTKKEMPEEFWRLFGIEKRPLE